MKTSFLIILVLAAVLSIVSCGGGLTGESTGVDDSTEGRGFPTYSPIPQGTSAPPAVNAFAASTGSLADEVTSTVFLNVESVAENTWSCLLDAGGNLRCRGLIDPDGPSSDRWACEQSITGMWNCSGNIDRETLRPEFWSCKNPAVGNWFCSGDIDGTDATMELWTCKMKSDSSWFCDGNIDKSTGSVERWSCDEMMGKWKCSYDLGRLFPLIVPVTSANPVSAPTPTATSSQQLVTPYPLPEQNNTILPHVFVGNANAGVRPAADGTEVSAWVIDFDAPVGTAIVVDGGYTLLVNQYGTESFGGRTLVFKLNGVTTGETSLWKAGGATILDLSLD